MVKFLDLLILLVLNLRRRRNKMTRKECLGIISEENRKHGLGQFVIFFLSPVTNSVDRRIIYSPDYAEGLMWLENTVMFYRNKKIPFASYSDGALHDAEGELFPD